MKDKDVSISGLITSGFFVVLPVLLAGLMLERIYRILQALLRPVLDLLPGTLFRNPTFRALAVCIALVALLLLVGLMARMRLGRAAGRWLESGILSRIPFYAVLRNLASGMAGSDDERSLRTVLVELTPGVRQLGLLVERHPDGSSTVFFPESPNPGAGTVFVVEASLIRDVDVPAHRLLRCFNRWGLGMATELTRANATDIKAKTDA